MPLSVAKPTLEQSILAAFEKVMSTAKGAGEKNEGAKIRKDLAKDLAAAIHDYVTAAQVNIASVVSTVPPGVALMAGPYPGATIAPGVANHAGFGNLQ